MDLVRFISALGLAVLMLMPRTVNASGDVFRFEASADDFHFELILVGREDPGSVQARWTGKPASTTMRRHHIDMDRARQRLFVHPAHADGESAFELRVSGTVDELWFEGRRLQGVADWTVW